MTTAAVDRILAILVTAVVATGLLTLRAGDPSASAVYTAHGILAWTLAATIALKLGRSLPRAVAGRRWGRLAVASAVALLGLSAIAGGVAWATGDRIVTIAGWTLLTLHAYAGLALVPLLLAHLVPRRWRLLWPGRWLGAWVGRGSGVGRASGTGRGTGTGVGHPATDRRAVAASGPGVHLSRRSVVAAVVLSAVGVAGWGAANVIEAIRGGERRFTGSRWLDPNGIPPPTTFFGEGTPPIDPGEWRLVVRGRVARPGAYTLEQLRALGSTELVAVLDCTSGWAMETMWGGVPTAAVLAAAGPEPAASRVDVRSVTGWGAALSLEEAGRTLLATHVAGEPLPAGNGAPCRLVVPDRRGLDWVKWVAEIEVA